MHLPYVVEAVADDQGRSVCWHYFVLFEWYCGLLLNGCWWVLLVHLLPCHPDSLRTSPGWLAHFQPEPLELHEWLLGKSFTGNGQEQENEELKGPPFSTAVLPLSVKSATVSKTLDSSTSISIIQPICLGRLAVNQWLYFTVCHIKKFRLHMYKIILLMVQDYVVGQTGN